MTVLNAEAGAISFAHLAGITSPVHAAKADAPNDGDDEKKKEEEAKAKADQDEADAKAKAEQEEQDEKDKAAKKAAADEDDEEKKAAAHFERGYAAANARVASVLGSRSFVRNPALGAHLMLNSTMSASGIIGALHNTPAVASADAGRSARNPNLGTSAPAVAVSTDTRWGAAFKRAGVLK